jgi:hypothetical protein
MKKGTLTDGLVYHAGFPNAAEDQAERIALNLDQLVVKHRASTFFWCLDTDIEALNWPAGTIVAVDRALGARANNLVVAVVDEDFMLCRVSQDRQLTGLDGSLLSGEVKIWGVATYAIQPLRD